MTTSPNNTAISLRIRHWHRRYRAAPPRAFAAERVMPDRVVASLDRSLAQIDRADEFVLIRAVNVRLIADRGGYTDDEIADRWGEAIGAAVKSAVDSADPRVVRRYADAVDHLVEFLLAILKGGDFEAWQFARFRSLLRETAADTLSATLDASRGQWPELMRRLAARAALAPILRRVSPEVLERLWLAVVFANGQTPSDGGVRPLFAAAWGILDDLAGCSRNGSEAARAFALYSARVVPRGNWTDARQLAEIVSDAVRFLMEHFQFAVPSERSIESAVQRLDWLDRDVLVRRLAEHLAAGLTTADHTVDRRLSSQESSRSPHSPLESSWAGAAVEILERLGARPPEGAAAAWAFAQRAPLVAPTMSVPDPRQIAECVFDAVRSLIDHFQLAVPTERSIESAVQRLAWLDRAVLVQRLTEHLAAGPPAAHPFAGPTRLARESEPKSDTQPRAPSEPWPLTSRSTRSTLDVRWLAVAEEVEARVLADWDPAHPTGSFNRHLALALLLEADRSFQGDAGATELVERLLERLASGARPTPADRRSPIAGGVAVATMAVASSSCPAEEREGRTEFAGLFLLLRAIHDLRLPEHARACFSVPRGDAAPWLLCELASFWSGRQITWPLDQGLAAFVRAATLADPPSDTPQTLCPSPESESRLQCRLVRSLMGLGDWPQPTVLRVALGESRSGPPWLLGGDASGTFVPFSARVSSPAHAREVVRRWSEELSACLDAPVATTTDSASSAYLGELSGKISDFERALSHPLHRAPAGWARHPVAATCAATADAVVRRWARWIRGFRLATSEYLLDRAVRRAGAVGRPKGRLVVTLDPRPIDAALRLSGLLDDYTILAHDGAVTVKFNTQRQ